MDSFDPESLKPTTENTSVEDVSDGSGAEISSRSAQRVGSKSTRYNLARKSSSVVSATSAAQSSTRGRQDRDMKVVGMASAIRADSNASGFDELKPSVEEAERKARENVASNPFYLALTGNYASMKVFLLYLVTLETLFTCFATVGVMLVWYYQKKDSSDTWSGGGLNWSLLGFAVVLPMSRSISFAFRRREQALARIAQFRSYTYQIYLGHCTWNWKDGKGRENADVDWPNQTDKVLIQLIGIGDELCRFLTMPTSTGTRHRIMESGHKEAAELMQVSYRLFDSLATRRMAKLTQLVEELKTAGLSSTECSRIRQYERSVCEALENLRQFKMYRTPQALRSFARIFTVILPPFYAPTFAQMAIDLESLGLAICMAVITTLSLTALFESIQVLEDPFIAFLTLDGIDVREELEVLHYQQLVNARGMLYPDADEFPEQNLAALTLENSTDVEQEVAVTSPIDRGSSAKELGEKSISFRAATRRPTLSKRTSAYGLNGSSLNNNSSSRNSSSGDVGRRELGKNWSTLKMNMSTARAFSTSNT